MSFSGTGLCLVSKQFESKVSGCTLIQGAHAAPRIYDSESFFHMSSPQSSSEEKIRDPSLNVQVPFRNNFVFIHQQPKILNFRLRRTVSWPPSPLHAKLMCECTWLQIPICIIAHNKIIVNIANWGEWTLATGKSEVKYFGLLGDHKKNHNGFWCTRQRCRFL